MKRRLAAILAADAVAFSAFAARDEPGAIRALKGHIGAAEPMIGLHSGRIVKSTGDGYLAEFGSVVDAVSCADQIQRTMAERNAAQDEASRLDFRIGVHVGDIVIDGDDILGDGVNVAARLEGVAPPGGVAISARVFEDIDGKLELTFASLGPKTLKNIARPVEVYALGAADAAPKAEAPIALPDKPSVAVLPFTNMSAAEEDDYFADGITEDIITALSYVPWIFVIARNSSFTYKGLNVDIRKVGEELGVRYVLEGSVRRAGKRLRVTGQLIDAETGAHIWAEKYDGEVEDVFELQDRISESVVAAIAPEIRGAEIQKGLQSRPDDLDAYQQFLRGLDCANRSRIPEAIGWLKRSYETAPTYGKPMAMHAWLETLVLQFSAPGVDLARAEAAALARRALDCAPDDAETVAMAGYAIGFTEGDHQFGLRCVDEATDRCPSYAWAWISGAQLTVFTGDADEGIRRAEIGLRLSPRDPLATRAYMPLSLASIIKEDWEGVLHYAGTGLSSNPRMRLFARYCMVACHRLGREEELRKYKRLHDELTPNFHYMDYIRVVRDDVKSSERIWGKFVTALSELGYPE